MSSKYTIKDVTKDLKFLVSLLQIFSVDDEGYWYDDDKDKRVSHKLDDDDQPRNIVIFQDPMPKGNYHIFNPFAEGIGRKSPAVTFFYNGLRAAFNARFSTVLRYMVQKILDNKTAPDETTLGHAFVRMSSVPVDRKTSVADVVDGKFVDEVKLILDRIGGEILFVPYLRIQATSKVKCDILTDPTWDDKYGKDIRKKSLLAFKAAVMGILGIESPDELSKFTIKYDPDWKSAPTLHTTLEVYWRLYDQFNDAIGEAFGTDTMAVDMSEFRDTIERLPFAYAIAKHMVQPAMPKQSVTSTQTVDTSRFASGGNNNSGVRRFEAPTAPIGGFAGGINPPSPSNGPRRFQAPTVDDPRFSDPTSPQYRGGSGSVWDNRTQSQPFIQPIPNSSGFGGSGLQSSYFGNPPFQPTGFSGGLNTTAPNNFASPITRRYFG